MIVIPMAAAALAMTTAARAASSAAITGAAASINRNAGMRRHDSDGQARFPAAPAPAAHPVNYSVYGGWADQCARMSMEALYARRAELLDINSRVFAETDAKDRPLNDAENNIVVRNQFHVRGLTDEINYRLAAA